MEPVLVINGSLARNARVVRRDMTLRGLSTCFSRARFRLSAARHVLADALRSSYEPWVSQHKCAEHTWASKHFLREAGFPSLDALFGMPEVLAMVVNDYHFRSQVFDSLYVHPLLPTENIWWADSFGSVHADGATVFFDGVCYGRTRIWHMTFPFRKLLLVWRRYRILRNWPWPKGPEDEGAGAVLSDGEQLALEITRAIGYRRDSRTERFLTRRREDTVNFLRNFEGVSEGHRSYFHKTMAEHVVAQIDAVIHKHE